MSRRRLVPVLITVGALLGVATPSRGAALPTGGRTPAYGSIGAGPGLAAAVRRAPVVAATPAGPGGTRVTIRVVGPSVTPPPVSTTTPRPRRTSQGNLPKTGPDVRILLPLGLAGLAAGLILVWIASLRRRRNATS